MRVLVVVLVVIVFLKGRVVGRVVWVFLVLML